MKEEILKAIILFFALLILFPSIGIAVANNISKGVIIGLIIGLVIGTIFLFFYLKDRL